jgi:hypothetical protein
VIICGYEVSRVEKSGSAFVLGPVFSGDAISDSESESGGLGTGIESA